MRFGIAKRVALAFGILLFLFFITSAVAFLLTTRIKSDFARIVNPESRQAAVLRNFDRDLRAAATALRDGDKEWSKPIDAAQSDLLELNSIVIDEGIREPINGQLDKLRQLGDEVVKASTRRRVALAALAASIRSAADDISKYLDSGGHTIEVWPLQRQKFAREVQVWLYELQGAIQAYVLAPGIPYGSTLGHAEQSIQKLASIYIDAGTSEAGRRWFQGLASELAKVRTLVPVVAGLTDEAARGADAFDRELAQLNQSMATSLRPLLEQQRRSAQEDVVAAIGQVIIYLSVMTAFGGLMGASTALVLIRGIVRPIVALTDGVKAMGSGELDYRISMKGDDEFGKLASTINRIAERRQQSEEALRRAANQDSLTKLPNRVVFQERLAEALSSATRIDRMVAVLLLDLDHFKDVNDTLGHPAGDALLKQVSARLLECARKSDTVCRLGGDEFGIIQTNLNSEIGVEVLARRIINSVAQPFDLGDERVFTATSIGVTVFPHDDREANKLIKNADLALYRAKQEGRNKYQLYDSEMNAEVLERKALEQDLREALLADDLFLNFQPKLDVASGRITGAEALVRWYHKERGMVSPGIFIPVAEDTGLINAVTDIVLRKVCLQIREWADAGLPNLKISFNLSPTDFKRENLVDLVTGAIENAKIDPRYLELEITEGMAMTTGEGINNMLAELRALGIGLAIDDFGTGYSSMAYLSRFPIDNLKIDQTFVRDIITDTDSANITMAIINLAHSLRVAVVAEGVEDERQFEFLRAGGCDEVQGYWISKPVHAAAFVEFVGNYNGHGNAASA